MSKGLGGFFLSALLCTLIFIVPITAQPLPDTVRLVCIGNSITAGWLTTNPSTDAYPVQLSYMLGGTWRVKNSGVSGRTMLRHGDYPIWNEQLFKDGLAFNPNVVTIMLGTNDSKPWNWDSLKIDFVGDYKAMIDTLRTLPGNPQIWVGLPPPAFSGAFSIRDSVITAEIIPMIKQVATDKGCSIIDMNSAMKSYGAYFSDGIHPNTTGSELIAEVFYSSLTGKTIRHIMDENCAAGKSVTVSESLDPNQFGGSNLVDSSRLTVWTTIGFPSSAVVDLGSIQKVDLYRVDFGNYAGTGYKFLIEAATTPGSWSTVVDSTTRTDTAEIVLIKTDSIDARYIRLTITGAIHPKGDTVSVADFRVVKSNGGVHAPVILIKKISATSSNVKCRFSTFWPAGAKGSMLTYQRIGSAGTFLATTGLKAGGSSFTVSSLKTGSVNAYYVESFLDGIIAASDTVIIDTNPTSVKETGLSAIPTGIVLQQCYPNPFNPTTTIAFSIPVKSFVSLKILDLLGREVTTIVSEELSAGNYSYRWNATGNASGIYFYRLNVGTYRETKKLVLLR
jgi:lysophospholipase L1-like esterase